MWFNFYVLDFFKLWIQINYRKCFNSLNLHMLLSVCIGAPVNPAMPSYGVNPMMPAMPGNSPTFFIHFFPDLGSYDDADYW